MRIGQNRSLFLLYFGGRDEHAADKGHTTVSGGEMENMRK